MSSTEPSTAALCFEDDRDVMSYLQALKSRGEATVVIPLGDTPDHYQVVVCPNSLYLSHSSGASISIPGDPIATLIARDWKSTTRPPVSVPVSDDLPMSRFEEQEWASALRQLLRSARNDHGIRVVDSLSGRLPTSRGELLDRSCFEVPAWIVASQAKAARPFLNDRASVLKSVASNEYIDGHRHVPTTDASILAGVSLPEHLGVPHFFQQRVESQGEFRIYRLIGATAGHYLQRASPSAMEAIDIRTLPLSDIKVTPAGRINKALLARVDQLADSVSSDDFSADFLLSEASVAAGGPRPEDMLLVDVNVPGSWTYYDDAGAISDLLSNNL